MVQTLINKVSGSLDYVLSILNQFPLETAHNKTQTRIFPLASTGVSVKAVLRREITISILYFFNKSSFHLTSQKSYPAKPIQLRYFTEVSGNKLNYMFFLSHRCPQ